MPSVRRARCPCAVGASRAPPPRGREGARQLGTGGPLAGSLTCRSSAEIPGAAVPGPGAEAVPPAEGPERGVHGGHRLLQPLPHGGQLPPGEPGPQPVCTTGTPLGGPGSSCPPPGSLTTSPFHGSPLCSLARTSKSSGKNSALFLTPRVVFGIFHIYLHMLKVRCAAHSRVLSALVLPESRWAGPARGEGRGVPLPRAGLRGPVLPAACQSRRPAAQRSAREAGVE